MRVVTWFLYIHHTWKITFKWRDLKLNIASKIIDYAGWFNLVAELRASWKKAEFVLADSFFSWLKKYCWENKVSKITLVKPVEDYVYKNFLKVQTKLLSYWIDLIFVDDTQSFFLTHDDFQKQYAKPPIMEYFYRFMRKKEDILIDTEWKPEWWKWNFDADNRKFDRKHEKTWNFTLDKNSWLEEAEKFYKTDLKFIQPTSRTESLELLDYFIENHLDTFWKLEDAMYQDDSYVHHSFLSSSINYWFLSPREVVKAIGNSWTAMNNKEWFIRQILGWREYMYHFFCSYKDTIYNENFLKHTKPLPDFFWKDWEKSSMNCLSTTLKQVQQENVSHHIQRLMIIGNYALLTGLDPHELNHWFFEYYTDAFEWVVTPNVLWMSQYSDWWKLATKPYIASANYVNKMSDYCKNCKYNPKEKNTQTACPLNYLYWNFVDENKEVFEKWRQHFVLKNLERVDIWKLRKLKERFMENEKSL